MSTTLAEQNVYAAQFSGLREHLPGVHLPWLGRLRKRGIDDFLSMGFPTTRLEDWKYTNIAPIRRIAFRLVDDGPMPSVPDLDLHAGPRLVFVNGRFAPAFSKIDGTQNLH